MGMSTIIMKGKEGLTTEEESGLATSSILTAKLERIFFITNIHI